MAFFPALLVPLIMAGVVVRHLGTRDAKWKGTPHESGAEILPLTGKHGESVGTLVGIRGLPSSLSFLVRRENAFDGMMKMFGVVREIETGDLAFDLAVYVESTDPFLVETLGADPALRRKLRTLVERALASSRFGSLVCHDGRLWIHLVTRKDQPEPTFAALRPFIDALVELRAVILERAGGRSDFRDPTARPVALITGFSTAVAVCGIAVATLIGFGWTRVVDQDALYEAAFWPSVAAFGVLFAIAWFVARRSARFHLVVLELLLAGLAGFVLAGWSVYGWLNRTFDSSAPVVVQARVDHAWVSHGRRRAPIHYVRLSQDDWPSWLGSPHALRVPWSSYGAIDAARGAEFVLHRGALGLPWYESVRGWVPPARDDE